MTFRSETHPDVRREPTRAGSPDRILRVRCAAVGFLVACAVLLVLPLQVQAQVANTDPHFTSDAAVSVDENAFTNRILFSHTVIAVDDEPSDTVTLALNGGAQQSHFGFNGATGVLSASAELDHESLPTTGDVGDDLRVTLIYEDYFDRDKELKAVSANAVRSVSDATLNDLTLEGATGGEAIVLSPAFAPATETYTASVANRIDAVTLTATQNGANATVAITSDDDTGTPGEAELDLSVGANTLTVTVTAEDATTKTYTITATRAAVPPAPTDCPADTIWCTTLGVGHAILSGQEQFQEQFGYISDFNLGDLLSTTFIYDHGDGDGEKSYRVKRIYNNKGYLYEGFIIGNFLDLTVRPTLPHGLVLQVGSRTFRVNADSDLGFLGSEDWNISTNPLSWTAGQHVTVSLRRPSTDATLTGLALKNAADDSTVELNETFATATMSYTADVLNAVASITFEPEKSDSNATVAYRNASDAALTDADTFKTGFQVALAESENTIKVKVTAEDGRTTDTYTVVVTRPRLTTTTPAPPGQIEVPSDWILIPADLPANADQFRLIFLSSTKTVGTSYDIAGYNTFIRIHAAAGPADIRVHSSDFRAVGCTPESDARDNTGTIGTGVRIYWLNGKKVANNNADFYDGTWDNEGSNDFRNEAGQAALDITQQSNYPYTGCDHDGTEKFSGGDSHALGEPRVTVARPDSSSGGPLSSSDDQPKGNRRPMYGLSPVFRVAASLVLNVNAIATDDIINIAEKAAGFDISGDTGTESGVSVSVEIGSTTLTTTSVDDSGTGTWSVSVPPNATYITGASVDVTVSAAKTGFTAPSDIQRTLAVDLAAPTAPSYTAPLSLQVGEAITAISPLGGAGIDEYSATGLPSGLSLDTGAGVISGTPDTANASTASVTVTVSDTAGNSATVDITFPAVAKGGQTLTGFQYSASSVTFGSAAPTVTAPGGVETTLSYSAEPSTVCMVDDVSGALTLVDAGECVVTATAEGAADYNEATATYTVTVHTAGLLVLNMSAIATDGIINIAEKAAGFDISGDTGTESGVSVSVEIGLTTLTTTSVDDSGTGTWSVSVPPNATYITGASVDVTVSAAKTGFTAPSDVQRTLAVDLAAPTAPSYTAPLSLQVGEAITAISPLGGAGIDEYGATGLPSGLSLDTGAGMISGTPDTANASTASVTVTVSDTAGNTATVDITFPAVAKGGQALTGFQYSASSVTFGSTAPTVTAPGGVETTLSYSAEPSTVCMVDDVSGALTLVDAGECVVTATAEGAADYNEATATFTVTVQAVGTLALTLDTIAGDDTVNIAEKAAGFDISGDTGTESGVSVSVEISSTTLTTTSADDGGTGTWSVSVPPNATYITGASVDVTVSAAKTGFTAPGDVQRTLTVDLTAPTAPSYTAPGTLKVGEAITAISPSGGAGIDEYGATGLPSGLSLDTGTGVIGGTPGTANASTASVTVTVSDTAGNTATVDITFPAVAKGGQALTGFQYSASSVTFGSAAPTVTAPGGVETTLSYSAEPSTVCMVDDVSGALTLVDAGECVVTATAEGAADYNEATATFTVTVQAVGTLALTLDTIAGDDTVNIAEKAAGFDISGDTGTESGVSVSVEISSTTLTTTSADDGGTGTWSVSVPPNATYITGASVDVTVSAAKTGFTAPGDVQRTLTVDLTAPTAPSYTAPGTLKVGEAITAISPSGGAGIDEYGATGLPSGLSLDTGTGVIGGTPGTANASTASVTVTVSDTAGNTATVDITFPAVAKGGQALTGFQYSASSVTFGSAAPTVTAPGGAQTTLSYSAEPSTVCMVDDVSGALTLVDAGECVVTATAEGAADYNEATATFTVTVQAVGTLALTLDTIAGDDTVNIAEKAAGFDISGDTGTESGVSVSVEIGSTTLTTTSADDGGTGTWSVSVPPNATYITGASVDVTVSAAKTGFTAPGDVQRTLTVDLTAPTAPSYTAPGTLKVGEAITAISPLGGAGIDEYGATGLPSGLSLDTGTGVIGGTPGTANASTASVTVTVSDTAGNSATVDITFPAVAKGGQTLTGFQYSASSVTFGSAAPTVTAPGGVETTLSYSAEPSTVCMVDDVSGALTLVDAGECVVTATAEGAADYNEATATYTVTVHTAGLLVLNMSAIATDGIINIAEKAAGFDISGDTGTESGVSVSVEIGLTTLTTTSVDDSGTGTWSVSVPPNATYITGASVDVTVSAAKTGFTAPSDVQRTLAVDLAAPTAPSYTAPLSLQVGEAITAISPLGGAGIDEYGATGLPSGLSLDTGAGMISGTPDTANASTASVTVTVSDTAGNTATVDITFPAVAKGGQALTGFQYSASSVTFGSTAPTVTAPGGVETTLSYSAEPSTVCMVDDVSGALTLVDAGECVVTATAEGAADYNEATATFTVTVQAVGTLALTLDTIAGDDTVNIAERAAGFEITGDTGSEGGVSVTVTVGATELTAISADTDPATWSVSVPPGGSYITGTSVDVTVSVTKTGFTAPGDVQRTLTVDLTAPTAPSYTAPGTLKVGEAITAISPSGGAGIDEYGATGLPSGLSLDTGAGMISGTPGTANASTASVTVTVSDTAGNTATVDITFPAVAKGGQALSGFQYSASSVTFGSTAPTVTAPGGAQTTVSYSATPLTVCTVGPTNGALTLEGAGECVITATAAGTDDYNEATATFTVTVQAVGTLALTLDTIAGDDTVNIAERAAGFEITGDTGSEGGVSVTVTVGATELTAISADTDPATWSVSVPPGGSYITGTSVDVTVSVTKTGFTAPGDVQRTLTVDLTAPTAPSYTAPGTLKVGEAITAISPSGGAGIDEYGATGLPSGLSLDTGAGMISGTPDTANASTASVTVTVSDTAGNTATVDITFPAVAKGGQALTGFGYSASSVTLVDTAPTVTAPSGAVTGISYSAEPSTVCMVDDVSGALTLVDAGECVVTATAEGAADYNEATATYTVTVHTAGVLVLNMSAIATDGIINIAEKAAGFDISGDTGTESGVSVSVEISSTTLTTTSADDGGTGTWSVSVPPNATYITGASVDVTVSAAKTGFTAPSDVQRTLTVDLAAPTAPSYTAPLSLQVGEAITAISPLGGAGIDEYGATGLPSGLSLDTGTGVIGGTPDTANASTASVTVTVSDTAGNTATVDITFPAVVQLTDNDQAVPGLVVSFDASAGAVRDGVEEGGAYSLGFSLSTKPGQTLTIPLTYTYLGGATAADFTGLPANVTFGENATSARVTMRPVDDFEDDPGESLKVSFGTLPGGVSVSSWSGRSTIIPVIDDDAPPGLSVADASAREWPNKKVCLNFVVTMDRMDVDHEVSVDYATVNGTAVAGQDFKPISGTLVFRPAESKRRTASKSLCVEVIDDSHDEGVEEMTLRLSNPVRAYLADETATGSISNTDKMPGAWLTRFGRTVADHVVDAVSNRWQGEASAENHLTIGGRQAGELFGWTGLGGQAGQDRGDTPDGPVLDETDAMGLMGSSGFAGVAPTGTDSGFGSAGRNMNSGTDPAMSMNLNDRNTALAGPSGVDREAGATPGSGATLGGRAAQSALLRALGLPDPRAGTDLRAALMGSSFFYSRAPDEDGEVLTPGWLGEWSAWGRTAATRFSGADGGLSLDGEAATAILGIDSRWNRWLAGVVVSYSEGQGAYTHPTASGGELASSLTALHPYARYELDERTSFWGVLGYGVGELSLTPERSGTALKTDLTNAMAAFGGQTALSVRPGRAGQFELALRSDARLTSMASETIEGLAGAEGQTSRVRLMLEGTGSMPLAFGGVLVPTLEAGLRYDAGDAETGAGLEVGGGLGYAGGGLSVEVNARGLLAHQDSEYEEWGFSGSIAYIPGKDGRGLSMRLGSAWGATQSGVQSLWNQQDASELGKNVAFEAAQRFEAELGYGIAGRRGNTLWVPLIAAQAADGGGQSLRMGLKLNSGPNLEAGLELGRRQGHPGADPEHAVQFRGALRW